MPKYAHLSDELWERLPWLMAERECAELLELYSGTSPEPHVVFGDVLVPVLARLLLGNDTDKRLHEAFAYIEELATSNDPRVSEVAVVSVIEGLQASESVRKKAREMMGPVSRDFADKIEQSRRR